MGIGEACSIGAALSWAGGVIVYKRLGETLPPLTLNLVKNLIVLAMVAPTVPLVHGLAWPALSAQAIGLAIVSGMLGIAVADTLYFKALNTLGAGRMGVVGNFYSPFVIVLSFLLLGERLNALQMLGFVLVSGGVLVVSSHDPQRKLSPETLRKELVWTAGEAWSDVTATWKDANTLAIEYTPAGADKPTLVERKLSDPVWKRI